MSVIRLKSRLSLGVLSQNLQLFYMNYYSIEFVIHKRFYICSKWVKGGETSSTISTCKSQGTQFLSFRKKPYAKQCQIKEIFVTLYTES